MGENASAVTRVQLHFVAGGDAEQADLSGGIVHGNQADRLLERQRAGRDLRADEQREWTRLRRIQSHAQLARVGIEAPKRDEWSGTGGVLPGRSHR